MAHWESAREELDFHALSLRIHESGGDEAI